LRKFGRNGPPIIVVASKTASVAFVAPCVTAFIIGAPRPFNKYHKGRANLLSREASQRLPHDNTYRHVVPHKIEKVARKARTSPINFVVLVLLQSAFDQDRAFDII
jgi:hypothetical protein